MTSCKLLSLNLYPIWCLSKSIKRLSVFLWTAIYCLSPVPQYLVLRIRPLSFKASVYPLPRTPNIYWEPLSGYRQRAVRRRLTDPLLSPEYLVTTGQQDASVSHVILGAERDPSGWWIIRKHCYENWHLMNNYFKNLFASFPSPPDGQAVSIKLLKPSWVRTRCQLPPASVWTVQSKFMAERAKTTPCKMVTLVSSGSSQNFGASILFLVCGSVCWH